MKEILEVVSILNRAEVKLIRNHYLTHTDPRITKRLQLFDLVRKGKATSDKDAADILYGSKPNSTYFTLKKNLWTDLVNNFYQQPEEGLTIAEDVNARFLCRKMIAIANVLSARTALSAFSKLLDEALEIAEAYECLPEKIQIFNLMKLLEGNRKGIRAFEEYSDKIHDTIEHLQNYLLAEKLFYGFVYPSIFGQPKDFDVEAYFDSALNQIKGLPYFDYSPSIKFFYYKLLINKYQQSNQLDLAIDSANTLLDLIDHSPSIRSNSRKGDIVFNLASIYLSKEDYPRAIDASAKASKLFAPLSLNKLICSNYAFLAYFRMGRLKEAAEIVKEAQSHPKIGSLEIEVNRWLLYTAILEFRAGDFAPALKNLHAITFVTKDKTGWMAQIKILEIMCHVELGNHLSAEYAVVNFNKLLYRNKEQADERLQAIARTLAHVSKHHFAFKAALEKKPSLLSGLDASTKGSTWKSINLDLIDFEGWINRKAKG